MKKLIYLPVCLGMLFFSAACENWFDVSPKSDVKAEDLFQQESGFRDVLTGVYSLMSAPESYGRQLSFGYVDVLAQYYNISGNTHRYIKTKDYLYREPYDKEVLSTIWSRQYKGIANLNAMLMFIDEQRGVFSGDEVYRIYKGEILALRGMLHFDMLRLFSASPAIDKERKAIPYLESYTNLPQHQLTVGAVLEKVVKDLNAARELMREVDPYGPNYAKLESLYRNHPLLRNRQKHLNYYAVTALLARVQLYAGNLPDALEAAREIVGEPGSEPVAPFSLTTAAATDERLFDSELLFALEEGKMQDNIDVYFGESVIKNGITNSSTALSISINNRNKLFAQQDPADDDYRLKLWFQETNSATAVMPGKYVNVGCIPLIRLSELYYIAAECSANQGLAYLNTLRAHRGLAAMTEVTDLQAEIAKEYSKEFMCEGQMFYYYKRLGLKRIGVYRTVAIEPEEVLFALEEGKMQDNIDVYFGESVIKNGITNSSTALSISINNRNKLFAQQDPADDDYRLKLWFQETNSATAVMPGKYVNVGCIPLIRLSELYYIAAECSANQGLAYLNTLRAHRGLAAMTEVTDLQAEIAKEYSKEFMCEGQMFYYYKRLGLKRIGVYRTVAIEPEEVYVIPLPDDELDFGLIE